MEIINNLATSINTCNNNNNNNNYYYYYYCYFYINIIINYIAIYKKKNYLSHFAGRTKSYSQAVVNMTSGI